MSTAPALSRPASAAPADHEVVQAWLSLAGIPSRPFALDEIVIKRRVVAYRLHGAVGNENVIAKVCERGTAQIEHLVYSQILPMSGLKALKSHGCVDIHGADTCWLFMEDAGGENFSPDPQVGHVALAARWLATMHARTAEQAHRAAERGDLPLRNVEHYLQHLSDARNRILESLSENPATAAHRQLLQDIVDQSEKVRNMQPFLQRFCDTAPQTLVHGDFVEKNLRVRENNGLPELMVFDWEVAGFGVPAADLAQCDDLDSYSRVSGRPLAELQRMELAGKIFRWACAVNWQSTSLIYPSVDRAVRSMQAYHDDMQVLLAEVAKL